MKYVDYNPEKHKSKTLYEIKSREVDDIVETYYDEVTDLETEGLAANIPYYFVVEEEEAG